jgi:hypothetical protein
MVVAILISGIRSRGIMITLNINRNIDALNTPQFNWVCMCQQNTENSADECLPCACIAISTIFSADAFVELHFWSPQ